MKKLTILLCMMLSCSFLGISQIYLGPKAGINIAGVGGDDADDVDSFVGFHIGAAANIPVSGEFSVQPELTYSLRGWKEGEVTIKIDYVEVAPVLNYQIVDRLDIQLAPSIGFNIGGKAEFDGDENDIDNINSTNVGLGLGAQYTLDNGLFFQARYDMSFSQIFDNDQFETEFDLKHCNIAISLGYLFDLGGSGSSDVIIN